ncbi:MAG: alpha/beta hydrolase family protein [Bryobacteraceae bacterium]
MRTLTLTSLALLMGTSALSAAEVKKSTVPATVEMRNLLSDSLGAARNIAVIVPPDYATSTARYPVLYLLHGYGDDHTAWSYMTNLTHYAADRNVIVVMPDGGVSFYVNAAGDEKAKFEDFIVKDLIAFADSNYRTIPLPRARAIAGLSMGGYGAAYLGLKHTRRYSAIGAFSGAIAYARRKGAVGSGEAAQRRLAEMLRIMGEPGSPARAERDPFTFVDKLDPATAPLIYIACGGQDFLVEDNRAFVKALAAKKIPYEYREVSPRAHSWDFWDDQIRIFLDLLAQKPGWSVR